MQKFNRIIFLILVVVAGGCKINVGPLPTASLALPPQYAGGDSTAAALPAVGDFFSDEKLSALIDTAMKNNFDLRLAVQRIEMARAGVRFTHGIDMPDLSAALVIGQRKFGKYTIDGVGNYDTGFSTNLDEKQRIPGPVVPDYYLGVQSQWEIDLWGKLKSKKKAAAARFIASEFGRELVRTSLVAEIAESYFELTILDNEKNMLDENILLQQAALEIVRVLKETGKANELGVELLSAQLLSSRVLRKEVNQKILSLENRINFLLGRFPQPIERSQLTWDLVIPPKLRTGVPSALLNNRPDIRQAEYEMLAADADLYAAKAAFYPSLNINAGIGLQAFKALVFFDPSSFAYTLAGGLVAPLFNRREIIAGLMASESEQKQSYLLYQKAIVNSFTEVYNFMNLIKNADEMYALKSKEVDILKSSVATSSELFKSGRANYLEVITAQKNALQSQLELISLRKTQFAAAIGLYKALGGGWNSTGG